MRLHQPLADGQAQAVAGGPAGLFAADQAGVLAEQLRQLLRRHALAFVGHRDGHVNPILCGGDADGRRIGRMSRRVGQEVVQHLDDAPPVGHHPGQVRRQVDVDGVPAAAAEERVPRPVHQAGHLRRLRRDRQRARLDTPRIQQVADEVDHVVGLLVDDPEELAHLGRVQLRRGAQQRGGRALDGGQRGAQLVAHHAQELGPQPLQLVQRRQVLHGDDHRFDHTVGQADRRGVDQHPDAAAVGNRQHDLFGPHRRGGAQHLRQGNLVKSELAPIGEPARRRLQQVPPGLARQAQAADNSPRLLVERHRFSAPGVEDHDAHGRGFDQGLEVGPGALLVLVRARVGDRRRRLRREQDQDFFVLVRELLPAFLVAEEEVADMLARGDASALPARSSTESRRPRIRATGRRRGSPPAAPLREGPAGARTAATRRASRRVGRARRA